MFVTIVSFALVCCLATRFDATIIGKFKKNFIKFLQF